MDPRWEGYDALSSALPAELSDLVGLVQAFEITLAADLHQCGVHPNQQRVLFRDLVAEALAGQ